MLRSFDKTTHKRHGVGTVDENEAGTETNNVQVVDGNFKDRALNNTINKNKKSNTNDLTTNTNKADLFGRKKNSNQILKEKQRLITLQEKAKPSTGLNEKPSIKRSQLKSVTPLKRPVSRGSSPTAKRVDVGQSERPPRQVEIEHGYHSEQESPYVPDDISPIDFDLFDGAVNMDAYETTIASELDTSPLHEIESFPTKRRQFHSTLPPVSKDLTVVDEIKQDLRTSSPTPSFTLTEPINDKTKDENAFVIPTDIEYCPTPEQELPYQPELEPVDLAMFSSSVHLSAYDLSKYFDDEVEFPEDLFDDEDVSGLAIDLVEDYGLFFDDVAVLFRTQDLSSFPGEEDQDIDYSEIPFSNHIFEDIPLLA